MKTCTFQEILNQAAEYTLRTRDKIVVSEQLLLQGYLATEFETLFTSQPWAFLIPDFVNVQPVDQSVSLNEGQANELGDILAVLTANPRTSRQYRHVGYELGDGVIWLDEPVGSVWIEALRPYPSAAFPDLNAMTLANFYAAVCPREWRQILARRASAELFNADGNLPGMGAQMGLAEKALAAAIQRFCPTPAWRGFHVNRRRP